MSYSGKNEEASHQDQEGFCSVEPKLFVKHDHRVDLFIARGAFLFSSDMPESIIDSPILDSDREGISDIILTGRTFWLSFVGFHDSDLFP